jgi:DnaJ-class molecular chaperone
MTPTKPETCGTCGGTGWIGFGWYFAFRCIACHGTGRRPEAKEK